MGLGSWNNIKVKMVGNHVKVFINGYLDIDYTDTEMSPEMASGSVAIYSRMPMCYTTTWTFLPNKHEKLLNILFRKIK
ncbi:hypothetical protein NARC_10069 [Candidatus Nitrosocosmicus arcticus]|uniref:3-keto-disaccharide hydrolase domain-containing protein n=1 Tax=Candidatus Nitrosocosmicus arcticus TaxID=2035267 RepID=A0A557SYJ5_9ARCH|nr:hypothetical protein NARC_10069 [Candidatus Nitrosocosmicus arcticus]